MRGLFRIVLLVFTAWCAGCSGDIFRQDSKERMVPLAQKARIKVDAGDLEGAVDLYRKALDADPRLARIHLDLALLLHGMGRDYVDTLYHYGRYLELQPETEKRKMIQDRMRQVSQTYAGIVLGSQTAGNQPIIRKLEKENSRLQEEVSLLREKNRLLKIKILQKQPAETPVSYRQENAAGGTSSTVAVPGERRYKIQHGDTLESIAVFFYDDADRWQDILNANKSIITSPDKLIAGQELVIP